MTAAGRSRLPPHLFAALLPLRRALFLVESDGRAGGGCSGAGDSSAEAGDSSAEAGGGCGAAADGGEEGGHALCVELVPLFDPLLSPRNTAVVACEERGPR